MKRLTDVAYWDENWWQFERPRRLWLYRDFDFETVRLFRPGAEGGRKRVLELGAGGSRVLPYLAKKFGYEVFGGDFSFPGCRLLQQNLALQSQPSRVVCEDLFQSALPAESFDIVYSSGLIEHFDDTRAVVVEHLRLAKPGGRVVFIVPNLQGLQGRITRRLAPPLWDVHRVFGPEELTGFLKACGFEGVGWGYLGTFFISIRRTHDWSRVRAWPAWLQLLVCNSVRLANGLLSLFFRLSPLRPHSRALSPAFYAEGIKPRM